MEKSHWEEGITFGEVCRIIGRKIWYVLGATVLGTALVVLLFWGVVNPKAISYSLEFHVSYPASQTMKYPDGTPFQYRDIISVSALNEAKATDVRFQSIDVEKLSDRDNIDISAQSVTSTEGTTVFTGTYVVTVKGSYFKNSALAGDFIHALANVPINRVKQMANSIDYTLDEEVFNRAAYSERLELLAEQKEALIAQYDEWIDLYRGNYTAGNKTLKNHRAEVMVVYGESTYLNLAAELENCGYVELNFLEAKRADLLEEKELNAKKIQALQAQKAERGTVTTTTTTAPTTSQPAVTVTTQKETLTELLVRNEQIDFQLEKLTKENITAFTAKVNAEYLKLNAAAKTITSVAGTVYAQQSTVYYTTTNVSSSGTIGLVYIAIFFPFVFFFLSSLVVFIIETIRRKKHPAPSSEEEQKESTL